MYKIITLSILAAGLLSAACFYAKYSPTSEQEDQISGAYEALTLFGEARTYPLSRLPEKAYYAAWEEARTLREYGVGNRSVDPWETMGPHNRGGRTLALTFNPQNPNTLYAGSASGGLWRSYTAGVGVDAWEQVETGFPVLGVSIIEFMPGDSTTLFIGTGEVYNYTAAGTGAAYRSTRGSYGMGILKSSDGGNTWEKSLDFTYDQNKGIWDIEIAPSDPEIIYAGTTDGVYKSTDGGNSWQWILDIVMANDIAVHPNDADLVVVGCGNFASPGFGIYRTTDGGTSWYKITENLPDYYEGKIQLAVAPSQPEILYASIGNGFSSANGASWLCRSSNFGQTWTIQNQTDYSQWQGWFAHDVVVSPHDPDELVVIGIEVWKSNNGGQTLEQKSVGGVGFPNPPIEGPDGNSNYVHSDCHDVIYHPTEPEIFYVASDGGIHRSTDNGTTYHSCNGRYQTAQFYNGFTNSNQDPDFCQGGLQDNGTIQWNGSASGVTWTRVFGGDGSWTATNPDNDDINFVSWQRLNVQRTTSGDDYSGLSIPKEDPIAFIAPYVVSPVNGNVLYAGSSVVAKSVDGGDSWSVTNGGNELDGNPALSMSISYQDPDVVYTATAPYLGNPGGVYVTTNGGSTWTDITGTLPDRYPMDLQVDPTDHAVAYVAYSGFGTGHVYRTTDYGATWEDISNGLPDVPTNAIEVDPLFPNNIYVGNDLGVYVSTDYGTTWAAYQEGMSKAVMVFDLRISPSNRKLRAATHGIGAFQRDLIEEPLTTSTNEEDAQAMDFSMRVFPNPAKDHITINYQLTENQVVTIDLLNHLGQVVQPVLKAQQMTGNQQHTVSLNGHTPGIYYCRMVTPGNLISKRIVLE